MMEPSSLNILFSFHCLTIFRASRCFFRPILVAEAKRVREIVKLKYADVVMTEEASSTSRTLIRQAKANDADAWRRLVHTYSRRIYRWCRHGGLQPADASNVAQEVLRSVARKLPDFRHEHATDTFRGWLRRITVNKINDHFRIESRQLAQPRGGTDAHRQLQHITLPPAYEPTWETAKPSGPSRILDAAQLEKVRSQFSERDWKMFWRVAVDGQSAVEVGDEFGVTANTVRIVKTRLLKKLRDQLTPPVSARHQTLKPYES